ncbi:unnamed protein product, partial [Prorocentrum cordatum]
MPASKAFWARPARAAGLQGAADLRGEPGEGLAEPPVVCFCGTPLAVDDAMCRMCHTVRSELVSSIRRQEAGAGRPRRSPRGGGGARLGAGLPGTELPTLLGRRAPGGRPAASPKLAAEGTPGGSCGSSEDADKPNVAHFEELQPAASPSFAAGASPRRRPPSLARLDSGSSISAPRVGSEASAVLGGASPGAAPLQPGAAR